MGNPRPEIRQPFSKINGRGVSQVGNPLAVIFPANDEGQRSENSTFGIPIRETHMGILSHSYQIYGKSWTPCKILNMLMI
jgi:hypothetical protein